MLAVLPFFLSFFFFFLQYFTDNYFATHSISFNSAVNLYFSCKVSCCLLGIVERIQSTENIFMRRHYYIHIMKCVARWICDFIPLSQKFSIINTAIPGKQVHISSADFNLILLQISMYAGVICFHWILEACSSCFCSLVSLVCQQDQGTGKEKIKEKIKVKKMQFDFSSPLAIFIPGQ